MRPEWKRIVAREWLVLLGCVVVAIVLGASLYLAISRIPPTSPDHTFIDFASGLAEALADGDPFAIALLAWPYLLVQLSRFTRWAWRTVRAPEVLDDA